jgi:maleylacetoacetate isomerase/maleylpyruvate isomerase
MNYYGYFRSSAAYRLRIAFGLKGLAPDFVAVHLTKDGGQQKTDAYRAVNPQALVPALLTDDNAVLTQSPAILEWLEETFPEPPLLPKDPVGRAHVRAFASVICCDIHPLQNLRVLQYLRKEYGQDQAGVDQWCRKWLGDGLAACEALVVRSGEHRFCFGDMPGMADICLIPQLFSADRFGVDLAAMPRLRAIREACEALQDFAAAHPSRQPDSEA